MQEQNAYQALFSVKMSVLRKYTCVYKKNIVSLHAKMHYYAL